MNFKKRWWVLFSVLVLFIGVAGFGCAPAEEEYEAPVAPETEEPAEPEGEGTTQPQGGGTGSEMPF